MKILLVGALTLVGFVPSYADEKPGNCPATLERKLLGEWRGGACMGDYIFHSDGTFEVRHFTPGQNILTGTWSLHWDALPPTLAATYKTSDIRQRSPDRTEFEYLGKTVDLKVLELNDESFIFQFPGRSDVTRHERGKMPEALEIAALEGTWVPLQYEEREQTEEFHNRHIVKGNKMTVQFDGATHAEGTITLDPTKTPKHLDFQLTSGQRHLVIYVRTEDYIIYCGRRDGARPTEFATGTGKGGDYLIAWKIQR